MGTTAPSRAAGHGQNTPTYHIQAHYLSWNQYKWKLIDVSHESPPPCRPWKCGILLPSCPKDTNLYLSIECKTVLELTLRFNWICISIWIESLMKEAFQSIIYSWENIFHCGKLEEIPFFEQLVYHKINSLLWVIHQK